eukprot:Tbor_TRINITY_DN4962_c0_g1::TRINITY_DN4962_c0_g1_i1::g.9737::m.9737
MRRSLLALTPISYIPSIMPLTTSYLADLEGNGHYFEEFLKISHAIFRDKKHRLQIRDNYRFVFGGDLCDRGYHDLRLAADLTDLKERYPDRVTLILGNRDTQKLKIKSLMHPLWWKGRDPADIVAPFYFGNRNFSRSFDNFLKYNAPNGPEPVAEDFLKYLLENYFSVPLGIINSKRELMEIRLQNEHYVKSGELLSWEGVSMLLDSISIEKEGVKSPGISPDQATEAYLNGCITNEEIVRLYDRVVCSDNSRDKLDNGPLITEASLDGIILRYLKLTQLAAIHEGALFTHGAPTDASVGYVPDGTLEERLYPTDGPAAPGRYMVEEGASAEQWVTELNKFHKEQLRQWELSPHFDADALKKYLKDPTRIDGWFPKRGGGSIFAYGYSKSAQNKSVIVGTYFKEKKRPPLGTRNSYAYEDIGYIGGKALRYLTKSGVNAVFNGHQPVGDMPFVMHQPGMRVVMADNSYCSAPTTENIPNHKKGRGRAVQEVLYNSETGTIRMHGRVNSGEPFDFILENNGHRTVGRRLYEGWWVRAPVYWNRDGTTSLVTTPLTQAIGSLRDSDEGIGYLLRRTADRFFTSEEMIVKDPSEIEKLIDRINKEEEEQLQDPCTISNEVKHEFDRNKISNL